LLANLCGGLLMGLALGAMHAHGELSPELRLFVTTGFLGGLTTFSTFSGESASLLLRGQWGWGAVHAGVHVIGSLLATFGGLALARVLMRG
jgi:CrcB protein